jgi:Asp-tRNA(Asn)/Glu-tRNA(Gln) amidotransferase A subunit family amidase
LAGKNFGEATAGSRHAPRLCVLPVSTLSAAEPSMLARFDSATSSLRALGGAIELVSPPAGFEQALEAHRTIMSVEGYWCLTNLVSRAPEMASDTLKAFLDEGRRRSASTYESALTVQRKLRKAFDAQMGSFDALLTIPTPGEAPSLETTGDPRFCTPWTLIGAPAITIPTGLGPAGLPLGLQLVGRPGRDGELLRAAEWVAERLTPLYPPMLGGPN